MRLGDRQLQADALGRQNLAPIVDQLFVCSAHRSDIAVQVVQAERIDAPVLLPQGGVPVDLIRERVSGETDHRYARVAHAQDVRPLLPEPFDRPIAT